MVLITKVVMGLRTLALLGMKLMKHLEASGFFGYYQGLCFAVNYMYWNVLIYGNWIITVEPYFFQNLFMI
jgi:hypothetical protein